MLGHSILNNQSMQSPLSAQSAIKPENGKKKRSLLMSLTLTSLIDAFSILVIFLLSSSSNSGQPLDMRGKLQLPASAQSESVGFGTVVKLDMGHYFVNDKEVSLDQLTKALYDITGKDSLIIQADRRAGFSSLSPVILAASHAGFEKFKFAVLQTSGSVQ